MHLFDGPDPDVDAVFIHSLPGILKYAHSYFEKRVLSDVLLMGLGHAHLDLTVDVQPLEELELYTCLSYHF